MKHSIIDGYDFESMMCGALNNIRLHEEELNALNVFPVPDGDTGTNMRRTVELGVESARHTKELNGYLKQLIPGMLMGARGNSGVILSQIFKGFGDALTRYETASASNLVAAFIKGYLAAYDAVIRPVEGTVLTVVREGTESTKKQLYRGLCVEDMLGILISEMKKVLNRTPELLPVLKEAGVVDSGGYGFIIMAEGMLKALYGETIEAVPAKAEEREAISPLPDTSSFGPKSTFDYGYCMEFTLQLLARYNPIKNFSLADYTEDLKLFGESIVVYLDDTRVRVHVHTLRPEKVIELSRRYGEFVFFKLENMQLQHNELSHPAEEAALPHTDLGIISVADGEGIAGLFKSLGAKIVIDGGRTMNTSVKTFLEAFEKVNSGSVVVLPNDKNIVQAAIQAQKMYKGKRDIKVLMTRSMAEGYFALASDIPGMPADERVESISEGFAGVGTVSVNIAGSERVIHGIDCHIGDFVGIANGDLVACGKDEAVVTIKAVSALPTEDKSQLLVFVGEKPLPEGFEESLEEAFPDMRIDYVQGGERGSELIIGII